MRSRMVPNSMTGFGSAEGPVGDGRLEIELRTVNHRHLNTQLRLPAKLQDVEVELRELVRRHIHRGHVTLAARWTQEISTDSRIALNIDRARDVVTALEELKKTLGLDGPIDIGFVARQPDVLTFAQSESGEFDGGEVRAVAEVALEQLAAARAKEGEALGAELARLLTSIEQQLSEVERRAPDRITAERDRLRAAVADLLDGRRLDEDRLAQEIALLADKLDITEEIVRLRAHLAAARDHLISTEPIGKRLGFLGQEMLREINTIGSKGNDTTIARAVIAMKGELEKFREQTENLE